MLRIKGLFDPANVFPPGMADEVRELLSSAGVQRNAVCWPDVQLHGAFLRLVRKATDDGLQRHWKQCKVMLALTTISAMVLSAVVGISMQKLFRQESRPPSKIDRLSFTLPAGSYNLQATNGDNYFFIPEAYVEHAKHMKGMVCIREEHGEN